MPDLDQALKDIVDACQPGPPPRFAVLQHRQRRRHRTRQAAAVVAVAGAVVAAATLPSSLIGHHAAQQPADGRVIPISATVSKPTDAPGPQSLAASRLGPAIRDCAGSELALRTAWHRSGPDLTGEATVSFGPYAAPGTKAPCRLSPNEPTVGLLGPGARPTGPQSTFQDQPAVTTPPVTPPRIVSDAHPVVVPLRLAGANCLNSSIVSLVGLTDGMLQATFAGTPVPCDPNEPSRDGTLTVGLPHTADEPSALVPVQRERLLLSIEAPQDVTEGSQLRFLAHLHNPTDAPIALSPCPTYGLAVARQDSDGTSESVRFGRLNCDDAPDAVPAGGELVFEMLADDPAAGQPRAHDAPELRMQWGFAGPALADATVAFRRPNTASSPAPSPDAVPADPQQAKARAQALVDGVGLPNGAREVGQPPSEALKQPAQTVAASRSETATRFWIVPDAYARVIAAVKASRQSGYTYDGGGETTQHGSLIAGSALFGPLVFSFAPLPDGTTGVRADAQVLWSPQRTPAQRVGRVVSVVATAYRGDISHVATQRTVTGQQAQHLADLVDALTIGQDVARSCTADFGGRQRLEFKRTDGTHQIVDGFFCGTVTLYVSGARALGLDLSPQLAQAVDSLVPISREPPR